MLETHRLLLRPWRVDEAEVLRELWSERDPRVPPHRRLDAEGRPSVADLAESIRPGGSFPQGLWAVGRRAEGDTIGYCGLVAGVRREPELAFELLRRSWGHGYATEAAQAVIDGARASGHRRLWASVWEWNAASRRVLTKLGFVEVEREDGSAGTNLVTMLSL